MWIHINNLYQAIWWAENLNRVWHLNLFSRTRVNKSLRILHGINYCNGYFKNKERLMKEKKEWKKERNSRIICRNVLPGNNNEIISVCLRKYARLGLLWWLSLFQDMWKVTSICGSLMRPTWPKLANLGPVVQSVVSLTSSLRVILLTVLADSIYNILIFFAEKKWVALQKLLTFFQQKISKYLRITRCKF